MSDRRPLRFWQPFNDWWRGELERLGRRPNAQEIVNWYQENAYDLWQDDAPSVQETRVHAKCLRSLPLVRDYFRSYRAKKRSGKGKNGEDASDDFDADDDTAQADNDRAPAAPAAARTGAGGRAARGRAPQAGSQAGGDDNHQHRQGGSPDHHQHHAGHHTQQQQRSSGGSGGSSSHHHKQTSSQSGGNMLQAAGTGLVPRISHMAHNLAQAARTVHHTPTGAAMAVAHQPPQYATPTTSATWQRSPPTQASEVSMRQQQELVRNYMHVHAQHAAAYQQQLALAALAEQFAASRASQQKQQQQQPAAVTAPQNSGHVVAQPLRPEQQHLPRSDHTLAPILQNQQPATPQLAPTQQGQQADTASPATSLPMQAMGWPGPQQQQQLKQQQLSPSHAAPHIAMEQPRSTPTAAHAAQQLLTTPAPQQTPATCTPSQALASHAAVPAPVHQDGPPGPQAPSCEQQQQGMVLHKQAMSNLTLQPQDGRTTLAPAQALLMARGGTNGPGTGSAEAPLQVYVGAHVYPGPAAGVAAINTQSTQSSPSHLMLAQHQHHHHHQQLAEQQRHHKRPALSSPHADVPQPIHTSIPHPSQQQHLQQHPPPQQEHGAAASAPAGSYEVPVPPPDASIMHDLYATQLAIFPAPGPPQLHHKQHQVQIPVPPPEPTQSLQLVAVPLHMKPHFATPVPPPHEYPHQPHQLQPQEHFFAHPLQHMGAPPPEAPMHWQLPGTSGTPTPSSMVPLHFADGSATQHQPAGMISLPHSTPASLSSRGGSGSGWESDVPVQAVQLVGTAQLGPAGAGQLFQPQQHARLPEPQHQQQHHHHHHQQQPFYVHQLMPAQPQAWQPHAFAPAGALPLLVHPLQQQHTSNNPSASPHAKRYELDVSAHHHLHMPPAGQPDTASLTHTQLPSLMEGLQSDQDHHHHHALRSDSQQPFLGMSDGGGADLLINQGPSSLAHSAADMALVVRHPLSGGGTGQDGYGSSTEQLLQITGTLHALPGVGLGFSAGVSGQYTAAHGAATVGQFSTTPASADIK